LSETSLQPILIRFWKSLLDEQQAGDGTGLLMCAPEILPECNNLKAARTLMALVPEWCAIAVQRHPVDFVNSRLRTCPETDFATHCLLWANAAQQLRKLKETFGPRVLVLEHADLLGAPEEVGARTANFLRLDKDAGQVMARTLGETRPGRTATFLRDAVLRLKDTSWSAAEISLFQFLCADQATGLGYTIDMEGVEQSRPLDLVRTMAERRRLSGKWLAGVPQNGETQPRVQCGDDSGVSGALHIGPVSAGGRRRLRVLLLPEIAGDHAELRFDVIQSLSRRPLFGQTFTLLKEGEVSIDTILPTHEGLLDFIFSGRNTGAPFELLLRHASLSHA
jgi:hypothetical protein